MKKRHGKVIDGCSSSEEDSPASRRSVRLLDCLELERRRLGQELHDGVCQRLKALEFVMAAVRNGLPSSCPLGAKLRGMESELNAALSCVHSLSEGMLPSGLRKEEFRGAMKALASNLSREFGADVRFRAEPSFRPADDFAALQLFRIAQEALSNACVHGKARSAAVSIIRGDAGSTAMSISDDGCGFDSGRALIRSSLGLRIMRERAASIGAALSVESAPGKGAKVSCAPLLGPRP